MNNTQSNSKMNQYSSLSNENFEGNNSEHIHYKKPSDFENKPISI